MYAAAMAGSWTTRDELAAQTVELLQLVNRSLAALAGAKQLPEFRRVPRPTPTAPPKRRSWPDFIRSLGGRT